VDEDELEDRSLDEELLVDELDETEELAEDELEGDDGDGEELDDELDGSQQPSPRTSTSHLQLSAKCFATP
jgi:hypothetical protein